MTRKPSDARGSLAGGATVIHWEDDHLTLYGGDCRTVLAELPAESVHCVVTSPPYWGLRDYGVSDQLGLEPTPEAYVENMVAVFREVRRVLRADGTLWLNLGDSYAGGGGFSPGAPSGATSKSGRHGAIGGLKQGGVPVVSGLKPKDLVGIPWRVAFALQADGWYLRSDIIWSKPNPMPESVTDRPTKAHEYLFLLTKSPRYYFDGEAVRRPISPHNLGVVSVTPHGDHVMAEGHRKQETRKYDEIKGANIRTVWDIATEPYPGAHFATFPRKLVEPCVKAGTSERGVCPECGAPWVRVVERESPPDFGRGEQSHASHRVPGHDAKRNNRGGLHPSDPITTGWRASCGHRREKVVSEKDPFGPDGRLVCAHRFFLNAHCPTCDGPPEPASAVVLDPFAGSGTTLLVAQALGRRGIGIDLNPDYLKQALVRNAQTPLGLIG
jgi:DNA modification methylase